MLKNIGLSEPMASFQPGRPNGHNIKNVSQKRMPTQSFNPNRLSYGMATDDFSASGSESFREGAAFHVLLNAGAHTSVGLALESSLHFLGILESKLDRIKTEIGRLQHAPIKAAQNFLEEAHGFEADSQKQTEYVTLAKRKLVEGAHALPPGIDQSKAFTLAADCAQQLNEPDSSVNLYKKLAKESLGIGYRDHVEKHQRLHQIVGPVANGATMVGGAAVGSIFFPIVPVFVAASLFSKKGRREFVAGLKENYGRWAIEHAASDRKKIAEFAAGFNNQPMEEWLLEQYQQLGASKEEEALKSIFRDDIKAWFPNKTFPQLPASH